MVKKTEKEHLNSKTETNTMEILLMENLKEKELILLIMVIIIQVILKMVYLMVMVMHISLQVEINMKESLKMVKKMEKECFYIMD